MANDVMVSFRGNNLTNHFLTNDEVKAKCPVAFLNTPSNPKVSDRYVHANTATIINDMAKLGWYPVEAKQKKARKNSSGIRSYHMIVFQSPDVKIYQNNEVEAFPRIILTNSHDGFNSFRFMVGLYRCVCSNGLIIADQSFADFSIRHMNYTFEDLRDLVKKVIADLPNQVGTINDMKAKILTDEQKYALATAMLRIRKNVPEEKEVNYSKTTLDDVLAAARKEDEGNSLWNVFNVLQEKMIKGGTKVEAGKKNKPMKLRAVKSFVSDLNMNHKMFETAKEYLAVA